MDQKTRDEIEQALAVANERDVFDRVASPYVSTSKTCRNCGDGGRLVAFRPLGMTTEHPTPQYCTKCLPKYARSRKQSRADAEHARLALEKRQSDPAEWMRYQMERRMPTWHTNLQDLVRRTPLPEPVGRVPSFVWEIPAGGADVLKTIRRGMRFQHGEGWAEGSFDAEKSSRHGRHHW